ncbi:triose-phosphate isomerase, partial [Glaesserella parasuis]|uniref:triose-phosphate isomerase n=1 Tax=Glaesserella parasuis TaxID=738 RepID=UPI003F350534
MSLTGERLMAATRRPIIAGNWKMFKTTGEAEAFTRALAQSVQAHRAADLPEIVLCPP